MEFVKKAKYELPDWRQKLKAERLDLSNANLSGIYLFRTDLRGADLVGADLSGSSMHCVDLMYAYMMGANLKDAHLDTSDLSEVDMRGADLTGANIGGVRLHNTLLSGANFERAYFDWTLVAHCDLSEAIGLEKVIHRGPSKIGLDTILKSKGRIPEVFLRGAGVPDDVIAYIPSLAERPFEYYTCFISWAEEDKQFCDKLYADMKSNGIICYRLPDNALIGKSTWVK